MVIIESKRNRFIKSNELIPNQAAHEQAFSGIIALPDTQKTPMLDGGTGV